MNVQIAGLSTGVVRRRPPQGRRRHLMGIAVCGVFIAGAAVITPGSGVAAASTPAPRVSHFIPSGVADLAPDDVYLSGTKLAPDGSPSWELRHWDGGSWSVTAGPGEVGYLDDVTALSPKDIWAVGLRPPPIWTHGGARTSRRLARDPASG